VEDLTLIQNRSDNLNDFDVPDGKSCSACRNLLANLERFLSMLEATRTSFASDWLTVDEIAAELKLSKSVIYRLIRNGELEAVDLVDSNGNTAQKGHYRITRSSLNRFLESRTIKPLPKPVTHSSHSARLPKVKNRLGL
jgi:excisionase family DNA binding protein